MADFHKALEVIAREKIPRRATFVYGPTALTERYVSVWRKRVATTTYVDADRGSPAALWDALGSTGHTDRHGVIVRGAHTLTDEIAPQLSAWATSRRIKDMHVLFVASFEDWPDEPRTKQPRNPALREVFANPRKSSLLVDASLPDTTIGRTHAAQLVRSVYPALGWAGARAVLEHTDGDVHKALEAAHKGRIVGTPNVEHIKVIAAHESHEQYTDALITCDKATASNVAQHVHPDGYGTVIARLDYALDVLARIHRTQKFKESTHALASRIGVHRTVVGRYRPHARHYTTKDVARRTAALLWADEQVRAGRRTGVLEMLSVQW